MSEAPTERVTIVVVPRDRFSTTDKCLDTLLANTPEPHDLLVVVGGASEAFKKRMNEKYSGKATFIFEKDFLNAGQSRNIALKRVKTRLAVLMENDVFVRKGWLTPLIECMQETGASMVVPVVLETPKTIHTAGNDLLMTYEKGKQYGVKVLRFAKKPYLEGSNLKRQPTDYGELHCQLVDVETAIRLNIYDEKLREVGECDSGLTLAKAGCKQWFEPRSVVFYALPSRINDPGDVKLFAWRWDMRGIRDGYDHFHKKWGFDITEYKRFRYFLADLNHKLGLLPRLYPSHATLFIDHLFQDMRAGVIDLLKIWRRFKVKLYGFDDWSA